MTNWKHKMDMVAIKSVYAINDFSVSPVTYDILQFIECAEMAGSRLEWSA